MTWFRRIGVASGLLSAQLVVTGVVSAQQPQEEEPEFEGVAEVEAPAHEATQRTVEKEQLTTIPGTRGDALRAVEIMPGVGRTQFATNAGPPLLRGSPSDESAVFFDGAQVPLLYHFGGLTSVFNSHLLEKVTLYPGNYSARYGRAAGGIVEARVRDPKTDAAHFVLELSALDSYALAEAPLGSRTSLAVAARRSNVDLFFESVLDDDSTAVVAAPVYYDYQAILAHRFSERQKLRLLVYGSYDAFELYLGEAAAEDPSLQGAIGSKTSFHRLQLELESRFSEVVEQELMLSVGPSPGRGQFGNLAFDYTSWDLNARAQWTIFAAPWLRLDTGFDVQALYVNFHFAGPMPGPSEGVPSQGTLASESRDVIDSSIRAARPAAFVEASLQPARQLLIIPGLRADYASEVGTWTVDPRIAARLELRSATTLKAGAGYYSQPPQYWEGISEFGNPDLTPFHTVQTSAGIEQDLGQHVRVDLEGFSKHWDDRVVGTKGGAPPRYVNAGTGEAYGSELLVDVHVQHLLQAYAAYTLSRSTRQDGDAEPRPFDHDQTHNLSLTANFELGHGFQVGARFRYVTGNPYSAVKAAVYDASTDTYRPLYDGVNDARNPAFHQLDVRVEKLWQLGPVGLTAYLEVMNAYNAKNQERRRYSFDYRESASVVGMPFFPNVGIRGEL